MIHPLSKTRWAFHICLGGWGISLLRLKKESVCVYHAKTTRATKVVSKQLIDQCQFFNGQFKYPNNSAKSSLLLNLLGAGTVASINTSSEPADPVINDLTGWCMCRKKIWNGSKEVLLWYILLKWPCHSKFWSIPLQDKTYGRYPCSSHLTSQMIRVKYSQLLVVG